MKGRLCMTQIYTATASETGRDSSLPVEFDSRIYKHEARAVLMRVFRYLSIIGRHLTWKKVINFIRIELDYLLVRPHCTGKPWSAKIEPTNVCNLQCTYCPREDTPYKLGMMSLQSFQ